MKFRLIILQLIVLIKISWGDNVNSMLMELIEGSMDATTDPCENFYQFACGNWDKVHTDVTKYHDSYRMIEYNTNKKMAKLLATTQNAADEPNFVTTVREYFRACVGVRQQRPLEYLKWLENNEGIPMLVKKSESKCDWLKHLAIMNKYGLTGIFMEELYLPILKKLQLQIPFRANEFKKLTHKQYSIIILRGFPKKDKATKLGINWDEFSTFESGLKRLENMTIRGNTKSFTVQSLNKIPWLQRFVKLSLQQKDIYNPGNDLKILIKDPEYMIQLNEYLQQHKPQFLCEYLKIRFLWHLLLTSFIPDITPEKCALKARNYMYLATDFLFEQHHPDLVQSIPRIHMLFDNIRTQYEKLLKANPNGFDAGVMKFLLHKLKTIKLKVGLLPRQYTVELLEDFFGSLNFTKNVNSNFYDYQMQLLRHKTSASQFMNLLSADDPATYLENTKRLSPYFLRNWNIIILPITTLQPPIYHPKLMDFFAYSSLGYILGHEITHCFDTIGTKRDPHGQFSDLYHEVINENMKFKENLRCLRRLNNAGIDEKLADVTGFRVAYQTYFELFPRDYEISVDLKGRNMTLDKLFFLNYAHFRCSSSHETFFLDNEHGTHEDRTVDALSHFPEFVKSFKCPEYTDMYVHKPCQLWRK